MKAALKVLDKLPVFNHSKQKLEAHLVVVEDEDGKVVEEHVELRTKQGAMMLAMSREDYDACLEWEQSNGN